MKLVFGKSDDVDYLLLWEKVVEYAYNTASMNKKYVLSRNFCDSRGKGEEDMYHSCTLYAFRERRDRISTRAVPSKLAR